MVCKREDLLLYAVTDRAWLKEPTIEALAEQVEEVLRGGATMVQLREKNLPEEEFLREAYAIRALCGRYGIPLIINDNVEIARTVDAAGVHLGQSDTVAAEARFVLGPEKIIGISAGTLQQALSAEAQGADYLGVGAVFPTGTKRDAVEVERETLCEICRAVAIPVVAIGGITADNVTELAGSGIAGIAVVSALFAQPDSEAAACGLRRIAKRIISVDGIQESV